MKIHHSTDIELPTNIDAGALKKALDEIPDHAHVSTAIVHIKADRPFDSDHTEVSLHAVWEAREHG